MDEAFSRTVNKKFTLNIENLEIFVVILYGRGVSGKKHLLVHDTWSRNCEITLCQEAMPKNRFCEILRFIRFDESLKTDKSALYSVWWKRFIRNSVACHKPGGFVTVDGQFFPKKAVCPFIQFMPSKPDKYGPKYELGVDVNSKHVANGFPCVGKDACSRTNARASDQFVVKLLQQYLAKERYVTADNYFTLIKLPKLLKSKKNKLTEELCTNKLYNSGDISLIAYQGKRNKNVVLLSNLHSDFDIAQYTLGYQRYKNQDVKYLEVSYCFLY